MKKTVLLVLVLTPIVLSSAGCAGKKIKRLEADLIACRESRTKLIQQQRSELDAPADEAAAEEEAVEDGQPVPVRRKSAVAVVVHVEDDCEAPTETNEPL